jgi:hypothetical protein
MMSDAKKSKSSTGRVFKRILAAPFVLLATIIILTEDWLWDDLARLAAAVGRLPIFRQFETFIVKLPPYAALAFFATPSLLLIPVKLAALYFISHGKATLGMATVVAAKLVGTALVARLFSLTKPALMRIQWFAWLYERFTAFKTRIYAALKATRIYRYAHQQRLRLRRVWLAWKDKRRGFWRRRWDATLKLMRRRKQPEI